MKRRVLAALLMIVMILSMGTVAVIAAEGDEEPSRAGSITAPENKKDIIDNGDGTYTIAMSVTGAAETSTVTEVTKANVILVVDTSNSMNQGSGTSGVSRLAAEKDALTKDNGIIDNLLKQNVPGDSLKSDIIEVAIVNFSTEGHVPQTWTTDAGLLKNTVNGLTTAQGTNWEEGLLNAKTLADTIKASQPNESVYVIFLTDGEPTTDATRPEAQRHVVNTNYAQEWGYASDDARGIVTAGYEFYGLFTWGSGNSSHYLSSLVNFAYTGEGNSNTALNEAYAKYFTDASDTETLIEALNQIVSDITSNVGFTDVEMTDGVTSMTASNVKATADGKVTGIKYYRSGGSYGTDGLGTEWTDAPTAVINDKGEVDWDLGDIVLEDGVTYTLAFTVWPKQESLDLVADLNNGIKKYSDLTEAEQAQISASGGHYSLKTNTDYPTVTYSVVTTTTEDGETKIEKSEPVTVTIANPDPVPLAEEKLNAKKEWEDSMDESQREEVGTSVTLYLLVDGEYYYTEDGKPVGVVLTEDSNWTETDYLAVAPGLMVTSDSPAYDSTKPQVTWNGKTYAIIEPGHEYVFEESDINYHFELTAYTHHPMQIGNKVFDVLFTKDESGNITGIESASEMGDTISATNTLKGGINIVKKVVDENGEEIETKDPFDIKVTLTDSEGEKLPDKESEDGTKFNIDYRIYYGTNNPAYETSGDRHRSDHIYVSGTEFTETIYVGDTIRVVNVESGAVYTVTEPDVATGYEYVETVYELAYAGVETDKDEDPDHTVQGNSASYATVTNKYTFGSLEVTKTVEAPEGADVDEEFEFTFNLYSDSTKETELEGTRYDYTITSADGSETDGTVEEGGTFNLKDGDKITIGLLPEGAFYEVTETAAAGYTVSSTGTTGEIVKDETKTAAFTNTLEETPPETVEFTVVKKWVDESDKYKVRPTELTLTLNGLPEGVSATKPSTIQKSGDTWTYTWENLPKYDNGKEIVYTVTEDKVPTGYVVSGSPAKNGGTITNTFKPVWGDPPVKKVIEGDKPAKKETFTFKLTAVSTTAEGLSGKMPMPDAAKGAQEMMMDVSAGETKEFGEFPIVIPGVYTYTITEVAGNTEGYTYSTEKHTVVYTVTLNDDNSLKCVKTVDGVEISGEEADEANASKFTFTNKYTKPEEAPPTGDTTNLILWGGMSLTSLLGLGYLFIKRRKEEQ